LKRSINTLFFSATDNTKKVVAGIADGMAGRMNEPAMVKHIDFTLPQGRQKTAVFCETDLVVVGVPVYAGRVPNVLLKYLNTLEGNGALAVAVVVYGNRHYDDALLELRDILIERNFTVIAAGAFIGEHSFSKTLGANRPDEKDMALVKDFAGQICAKLTAQNIFDNIAVKGSNPYKKYFAPKDKNGNAIKGFHLIKPKTNEDCIDCKLCAEVCPMGSIDYDKPSQMAGICIKCCACIKKCPVQAKYFDDENYLWHKEELEINYARRSEPEIFV
jgi:NAD-dependent dihydropyrimidine dehydrogenase PreA subunit/protein involved in ribonucleotide reduction